MIKNLKASLGILRSIAIYYWKPFNRRRLKKFYSQFINQNDLCFDIGAHLGNRTDAWDLLGAKVIALEPQPQCMTYLQKRFGNKSNLILVEKAVGSKPGKASFFISELTPTISTMSDKEWRSTIADDTSFKINWEKEIKVEVVTLDQLIEQFGVPKFCKIDVENFELEVLKGLSQPIPALSLEYYSSNMDMTLKCIDQLELIGNFEYNWTHAESQNFNASSWLTAEQLKTSFSSIKKKGVSGDFYARISKS